MKTVFSVPLNRREWSWAGFCLLISLGVMAVHYLPGWWQGERTDLLVMYRPDTGDSDYYPLTRQLGEGRFGEGFTAGKIGEGWIGFPGASVWFHGVALRWFGPAGFAGADILVPAAYFLVGARFLISAGVAAVPAMLLALFGALRGFSALADRLVDLFGYSLRALPFYISFLQTWELRFPRNFVSDIFVLGALGQWLQVARAGLPDGRSWWVVTAVWLALVLQSDVYSFAALGLLFTSTFIVEAAARRIRPDVEFSKSAAIGAAAMILLSTPFLLQRLHTSPDILERFGVFTLARGKALTLAARTTYYFPRMFIGFTLGLPWLWWFWVRKRPDLASVSLRTAFALTLQQISAYAAMPAFVALTGQAVQLYHFRDAAHTLVGWSAIAVIGLGLSGVANRAAILRVAEKPFVRRTGFFLTLATCIALLGTLQREASHRRAAPGPAHSIGTSLPAWAQTYHRDWAALAVELDQPRYASARVLATADGELYSWWTGLRNRESFLAQAFVTALPDRDLLERLAGFARLNQISADQFLPWVTTVTYTKPFSHWFACARYGANAFHAYSSPDDYTRAQLQEIAGVTDPLDCWHLIIPQSGLRRLQQAFDTAQEASPKATPLPELMILTGEFPQLVPAPRQFSLVYQNPTFRVYRSQQSRSAEATLRPFGADAGFKVVR